MLKADWDDISRCNAMRPAFLWYTVSQDESGKKVLLEVATREVDDFEVLYMAVRLKPIRDGDGVLVLSGCFGSCSCGRQRTFAQIHQRRPRAAEIRAGLFP